MPISKTLSARTCRQILFWSVLVSGILAAGKVLIDWKYQSIRDTVPRDLLATLGAIYFPLLGQVLAYFITDLRQADEQDTVVRRDAAIGVFTITGIWLLVLPTIVFLIGPFITGTTAVDTLDSFKLTGTGLTAGLVALFQATAKSA